MTQTNTLVIGLGSNAPDKKERLQKAVDHLSRVMREVKQSDIYETPPFNGIGDSYMNTVMAATTTETLENLTRELKTMEKDAGRTPGDGETVALDLDIVIWDGRIIRPADFERPYFNIGYRQLLADGAFQYPL